MRSAASRQCSGDRPGWIGTRMQRIGIERPLNVPANLPCAIERRFDAHQRWRLGSKADTHALCDPKLSGDEHADGLDKALGVRGFAEVQSSCQERAAKVAPAVRIGQDE